MNGDDEKGSELVPTPGGDQQGNEIRNAFRAALGQFIDPDDDATPYPNRVEGGYTWTPVGPVLDRLAAAIAPLVDKLDKVRAHVAKGAPVCLYEWEQGYGAALDDVEKILDGKEPTP